jgi:hypothetical protein
MEVKMAGNIFRELRKESGRHFGSCGKWNQTFPIAGTLKSILLAMAVFVFLNPAPVQAGGPLPEGEGRNLVSKKCQQCHNLDPIMKMRGSGAQWSEILEEMVDNGLVLNAKDRGTVLKYLETHLGLSPKK